MYVWDWGEGGVCEEDIKGFRLIYRCVIIFYYNKWINIRKYMYKNDN